MTQEEYIELVREYNIAKATISKSATIKDCFSKNKKECAEPIVNAHSLQRQGALKQLESNRDGNMILYSHTERQHNKEHDFLDLKPIGRKAASTFYGFCSFHDTNIFSKIENDPESTDINSDEHCFLHSYRSFAHSYHRKYEELKFYESKEEEIVKLHKKLHGEKGLDFAIKGVRTALQDLSKPKELLDNWLENKEFDKLDYLCYEYPYRIPVACAASTSPAYNYKNKPINISINPNYQYSNIITTVIPFKNRSIVILAAFENEPNGSSYLDDIDNIEYELIQQKFISYHIISGAENCYISPDFYDSKRIEWKKNYCQMIDYIANHYTPHMGFNKHFPINYFDKSQALQ